MSKHPLAAAVAATLCLSAAPALAQGQSCFFLTQWQGWKAPDDHTVYLNVSGNKTYRLDMSTSCPELLWPDARLIYHNHGGGDSICGPLDLDLKVASGGGPGSMASPCIVKSMRLLSPDEAAAIPKKFRP